MKGITWSLSRFIIIAGENFHCRLLTNGCMRPFSSITSEMKLMFSANSHVGQKDASFPKLILFTGEEAGLILTGLQTGLVLFHLLTQ